MTDTRNEGPGEDGLAKEENLYAKAQRLATGSAPVDGAEQQQDVEGIDWLNLVQQAETQGGQFMLDQIKGAWDRSYRAFHNQHFLDSKYRSQAFKGRSKLFRPKTRSAVRKANAAAAAALFSNKDTVSCTAGNEADPRQRASAALMQEIINYRTDRTSGRNAIPWFRTAIGAHQDTYIMSACLTKQYWKLELEKKTGTEPVLNPDGTPVLHGETGQPMMRTVHTYSPKVDRPEIALCPLENAIIDSAAPWVDPIQGAAYFIVKWPMRIDEIRKMEQHPLTPWKHVEESKLKSAGSDQKMQASGTRAVRDRGMDRMDRTATGSGKFEVIWVYEVFMRYNGEDVTFWSAGSRDYLTDPKPVREVYPEQDGDRPYVLGVGSLESHRIFPMGHVESWQPLQQEVNDLANLRLDQVKQSVSPIAFVKRGRQVDLGALQRRGPNTTILRTEKEDIEFDRQPEVPSSAYAEMERLNVDFDDLAGQFNSGSVQTNRSLNETVGGLNLISSAANSVQEFDLRTWVETWVEPVMGQIVKLEQYYESDEKILALCGDRAQLWLKHGVSEIDDALMTDQVTIRVDVGLGASNPQTKLGNFAGALKIVEPLWTNHPQVQSGEMVPNLEAITDHVFSLSGVRDGAAQFLIKGQPKGNPVGDAQADKLKSDAEKNRSQANLNIAKAAETQARLQMDFADLVHGQQLDRAQLVNQVRNEREGVQRERQNDERAQRNTDADRDMRKQEFQAKQSETGGKPTKAAPAPQQSKDDEFAAKLMALLEQRNKPRKFNFIRDPQTNRIVGAEEVQAGVQ
jgi:hypothetical protein